MMYLYSGYGLDVALNPQQREEISPSCKAAVKLATGSASLPPNGHQRLFLWPQSKGENSPPSTAEAK
jgi:hypothetical protein